MIYIDNRAGAVELAPVFQQHRTHPGISIRRLPAADFCFSGHGPSGPVMIGIERKSIISRDILSSMRTGRLLGEQLPKLLDNYEYPYLVIEGWERVRVNPQTGMLEELCGRKWYPIRLGRQPFLALELLSYLQTIETMTRVRIHHTDNEADTVEDVLVLEHWFSKPWEKHHATALHTPPEYATIGKASTVRRIAFALNGVGWDRSAAVAAAFPTPAHLICRDPEKCIEMKCARPAADWQEIGGIGKILSKKIWNELHGDAGGGID